MISGYIDADFNIQPVCTPQGNLLQCSGNHPFPDHNVELGIFDVGKKPCRRKQATFRIVPANQRFCTDQSLCPQIDFRLVIKLELIFLQALLDALQ